MIDVNQIAEFDESFRKPVDQLVKIVSDTKLPFAIVGSSEQAAELNKERAEGKELSISPSFAEAVANIGAAESTPAATTETEATASSEDAGEEKAADSKEEKGEG